MTLARRLTGLQRGAQPFSPLAISGLVAWYDMGDPSTLFTDTGRTTPVASDGDIIKGVTDRSGNSHHLSEATNGPTYKTAIQNGLSVARFDGSNDQLESSAVTVSQPDTVAIVVKLISNETGGNNSEFIDGNTNRQILYKDIGALKWSYYAGSVVNGSVGTDFSYHMHFVIFDGASSVYRVDLAANATGNPGANNLSPLRFGFDPAGHWYNMELAEVAVYDSALSSGDRDDLEDYLKTKWGTP